MELQRSDPSGAGITRHRHGRGFSYRDASGNRITDPALLDRIQRLVIPPAWRDVWICPDGHGHIQAVGTDDAGRRQYRYHDDWRIQRDREKFERIARLGERMPEVRAKVAEDLAGRGLTCERVLAAAVRMLDIGVFRVGGEQYAPGDDESDDGTFGLATVRREHIRRRAGAVVFDYPAKGGLQRTITLHDDAIYKVVVSLLRRRGGGEELLCYRTGRSKWHDVTSTDINARVKELAGDEFTAKDLRTWGGTVHAAVALAQEAENGVPETKRGTVRAVNSALDKVAEHLGNTRAVARSSYVAPHVVDEFESGTTIAPALEVPPDTDDLGEEGRDRAERAVLEMLEN